MQYLLNDICELLHQGKDFVLLTILEQSGSSPRGVGACMLVDGQGKTRGTIGGGAVEYEATKDASAVYGEKGSETRLYRLNTNQVADLGMICGGQVQVLFQYMPAVPEIQALFDDLAKKRKAGQKVCLVRGVENGQAMYIQMAEGENLPDRATFADGILTEPVSQGARVYVFGGGHVSQALVPLLAYIDFRVTVCEDRAEFADPALFPAAENTVLAGFDRMFQEIIVTGADYAVVMTRGHQADYEILRELLKTPASYIGCIGSRHKVAITKQRLLEEGFSEADFARIHTPIGLSIGAETPAEIAVSVAAEMIQHRAGKA